MPINQTANLLAYFNQNTPNNSQVTPVPTITYPPIPNAIGSFQTAALSGMTVNAILSPFSTLPVSGISTLNSPATIGVFTPPIFASGVPGTMAYNNAYTDPNLPATPAIPAAQTGYFTPSGQNVNITTNNSPATPVAPFTPASSLLGLGEAVATPPNNLSPISALVAGDNESWRGNALAGDNITIGTVDYLNNTHGAGYTPSMKTSQYAGIGGADGALTYEPVGDPILMGLKNVNINYNSNAKYYTNGITSTRFADITDMSSEISTWGENTTTLKSIYESSNFATMVTRFDDSSLKPHVLRGIQMESPNYDKVDGIPASATEHKKRLELAIDNSTWQGGWKERRKMLRNFQFQSRFQLGLGILPHLFLMGGPYNNNQDLKIKDKEGLLAMASAKAWILGGTIARVPHHLTNYSMLNSLGIKYGFSPFGEKLYNMLGKLSAKLELANVDLVPFYFKYYHRSKPNNSPLFSTEEDVSTGMLQFRGTLKTISHSLTPQWSSKKYFGRPDSVHTYSGFGQNLAFSFTVYASTRNDMVQMYQNLNDLVSLVKPGWDSSMSFMKAPVTEMTIGDYMTKQPGFIASLSISPDEQIYWDLGKDPIKGLPQLLQAVPQGLIDSVPFIGANPKKLRTNRESLLEFPLAKAGNPQGKVVPRAYNISITYTMIEKEMPDADGAPTWDYEKTIF